MRTARRTLALILALLLAFASQAQSRKYTLFNNDTYTLENGLKVITVHYTRAPIVLQMIFYNAGAIDETDGKSGAAHLLEHMMFKGPNASFSKTITSLGGEDNAFTTRDFTAYHQMVSSNHLEKIISMEAARMRSLDFSQEEFDTEKQVVVEERMMRVENSPTAVFGEKLDAALWGAGHPYAVPTIGIMEELKALEGQDVKDFHDNFYRPNNAILVIVGDFKDEELKALIEKHYGPIEAKTVTRKTYPEAKTQVHLIKEYHPLVDQDVITYDCIVPNFSDPSTYSYLFLSELLAGTGYNSKAYQELAVRNKLASHVYSSYTGFSKGGGSFSIFITPTGKDKAEDIDRILTEEIVRIKDKGASFKEIRDVRNSYLADMTYMQEDPESIAIMLGKSALLGFDVEKLEEKISAVKSDDLKKAAKGLHENDKCVRGILMKEEGKK